MTCACTGGWVAYEDKHGECKCIPAECNSGENIFYGCAGNESLEECRKRLRERECRTKWIAHKQPENCWGACGDCRDLGCDDGYTCVELTGKRGEKMWGCFTYAPSECEEE